MISLTLLALSLNAATWTVDDDGPADFREISQAIASAVDGDVLLVEPGQYGSFFLDKDLAIVGRVGAPRPEVAGPNLIASPTGFTISRLRMGSVRVNSVLGPGRFDDCRFPAVGGPADYGLQVTGSNQVLVSRSVVQGESPASGDGGLALWVVASTVTLVDTNVRGGDGAVAAGSGPTDGGDALLALFGAHVVAVSGDLRGGDAGGDPTPGACSFGVAGDGVRALGNSTVGLRGSSVDQVLPGEVGPFLCGGVPGVSGIAEGGSTIVFSGVTHRGFTTGAGENSLVPAEPAEPFLLVTGPNAPGTNGVLRLFGPSGQPALLIGALDTSFTEVPGVAGPLWLDPALAFFVGVLPTAGLDTPANCPYPVPNDAALSGASARFQCVLPQQGDPTGPGAASTNAVDVIVRF
ncbi:MAG: hypothetical protein ACF8XB_09145 [Planctomycetota bacterium JB042]